MAAKATLMRSTCAIPASRTSCIALRKGSASAKKAEGEKLAVKEVADAAKWADVVMMLTPDELAGRHLPRSPRTTT